jgi:hypothetical protein
MSKFSRTVILTAIALIIIPHFVYSGWIQTYGTIARDDGEWVEQTTDSGFIICGSTYYVEGIPNAEGGYLIKTNSEGQAQWIRTYLAAEELHGLFHCIQQTADKGYVMVGEGNGDPFEIDLWLARTDSMGDTLWTRYYGEKGIDKGWFVRQLPDGGFIIGGSTGSMSDARRALWVLRTDSEGDTLWTRTYGEGDVNYWAYCVNPTSDSAYILTGGNGLYQRLWLLKVDDAGDTLWTREYGNVASGRYVEETADGGFIVTGTTAIGLLSAVYVIKTDANGDSVWSTRLLGVGNNEGRCIHQTPDGGYILGALHNYNSATNTADAWLVKLNEDGDTIWTRVFGGPGRYDDIRCVQLTLDGGYVITGTTDTKEPEKSYEIWLIKTDSLGYVSIAEDKPDPQPAQVEVTSTVDTQITLYYENQPNGFHAHVYDASGQKVGEIHNASASGTIEWGQGQQAGMYFIRELSGTSSVRKVVLVK